MYPLKDIDVAIDKGIDLLRSDVETVSDNLPLKLVQHYLMAHKPWEDHAMAKDRIYSIILKFPHSEPKENELSANESPFMLP